jgi:hypothetical protein
MVTGYVKQMVSIWLRKSLRRTISIRPMPWNQGFIAKSAANSKARKILVILDACFSGEALGDVIGTISRVIGDQPPDLMRRRGIQILASAHALQKAQEGIVSGILKDVLTGSKAGRRWSDEDRFIDGIDSRPLSMTRSRNERPIN